MEVISEDSINRWIVPHLSVSKRGPKLQVNASEIVSTILYKLKTGCQWRELPTKECFVGRRISWQEVYHHFSKWANDGSLRKEVKGLLKNIIQQPISLQKLFMLLN
ncbi:transposase [Pontibacter sp. 172403-2]|uniref:transposase n=1 Tax=Pontibacter rufus TaxID=2791028 RepID=UPI0018B002BB|nr:transposase [Pontibacter sp. 172403-2]MBF9255736.1 transposase [Pontibacter sp. 172403-2]